MRNDDRGTVIKNESKKEKKERNKEKNKHFLKNLILH